ncbi:hypothetical protein GCM10011579_007320 [Streptomyces albiflavescens]|uniref:Uncharacterized protein n=1 Tax=Streptomyces albiflavescens TaxID=1623582 RepID=A0A918CZC1_9ACTN|nr:hypothetical protein GCM10011579_007320 [Streptomyces albiflavescens]
MAQVQMVPAGLRDPDAVAAEERLVGQGLGHGAVYADHLRLQPQAGHHAALPDAVQHLVDALLPRET